MSTDIATIEGIEEIPTDWRPKYRKASMALTSFYGGKKNGRMLQLTISADDQHRHIQLHRNQVDELLGAILRWRVR